MIAIKYLLFLTMMILLFSVGCEVNDIDGYRKNNNITKDTEFVNKDSINNIYTNGNGHKENQINTNITVSDVPDSSTLLKKDNKDEYIELYKHYWETVIMPTYGLLELDYIELKRHGNMSAEEFIEHERNIFNNSHSYNDFWKLVEQASMYTILNFDSSKTIISALITYINDDELPELITTRLVIEKNERDHDGLYLIMEIYSVKNKKVSLRSQHKSFDLFGIARTSYDIAIKSTATGNDFIITNSEKMQSYNNENTVILSLTDVDLSEKFNMNKFSGESLLEYEVNDKETGIFFYARSNSVSDINDWELTGNIPNGESWVSIIDVGEYFSQLTKDTLKNVSYFMQIKISKTDPTSEFYLGRPYISDVSIITRIISPELID